MSDSEVKPSDDGLDDMIDPIEGLKQLEKLISEAKEYDSKQKVSFNGNKMLNDLLDKPIGAENGEEDEDMPEEDGDKDIEDESELIDEALDEVADEDKKRGLKRNIEDEDQDGDDENEDEEEEEDDEEDEEKDEDNDEEKDRDNEEEEDEETKCPNVSVIPTTRKSIITSSSSSKKKKKKSSNPTLRKNIKSILNESELDKETQLARKEEEERIARQRERSQQRWQELQSKQMQSLFGGPLNSMPNNMNALNQRFAEIDDEVLLSSDDEEDKNISNVDPLFRQKPPFNGISMTEVIDLSSSDDESQNKRTDFAHPGINLDYNMTGAYDDDDVAIIDSSESGSDGNFQDANNCGSHTDDALNTPDAEGRVLVNVAHPADDPDIYLAPQITKKVKPHQIGGIRFLYDNVIESMERFKKSSGLGCILSHSMGLGKTMQVISFIDIFLTHTEAKYVLCIVPINTLQNWIHEFNMWLPEEGTIDKYFKKDETNEDVKYRNFKVFAINEAKSMTARAKQILNWRKFGGVLLLGYEMYRILTSVNKNKSKKDEDIDPKTLNQINNEVKIALIDPGPDLVVCDEGHRIKNCNAATSQALKNIKTKRRIVLTGYPLQNKLMEYWCMVDFVRPNYLGQKNEFTNMFERPITNGQCIDSTPHDRQVMKYRAHVLYHMLKGFVQRRSHSVLKKALPLKTEYVIMCRMTKIQKNLMLAFLDTAIKDPDALGTIKGRISTLTLFAVCCKVWNHPDVVYDIVRQGIVTDNDFDLDYVPKNNRSPARNNRRRRVANGCTSNAEPNDETISPFIDNPSNLFDTPLRNQRDGVLDFTWAEDMLSDYIPGLIENSFKMVILFEIITECLAIGDRLLIFSQSLLTLDLIERFLQSREVPKTRTKWCKNQTYYRLDGSTSSHERERYINLFNNTDSAHLFLISTRAGSLGINLIGANRIVIFDASWNPCHDAQAACRIYRYGQPKPCYIYRLVCDNSLEKKIYDRQVNKQGMANRVVDEQNVEANFTWKEINSLLDDLQRINEPPVEVYSDEQLSKFGDEMIKKICLKLNYSITRLPFEHESLLLDRKEQKLSSAEKRIAFGHYEEAKKLGPMGRNMDFNHALAAMRTHMSARNFSYPYQMPFQNSSPLPSQITPTPHFMHNNNMSQYPDVSQPLPPYPPPPRGHTSTQFINFESIAETLVKNGNTVKKVRIPNDLSINVGPSSSVTIKKGEEVMVIQTQKGLYLRTSDGNIISIKNNNNPFGSQSFNSFTPISKLKDSFGIIQPNLQCGGTVHCVTPSHSRASSTISHPPEVVQLSDDDDEDCAEELSIQTIDNTLDKTQNISTASEQSILTNGLTGSSTALSLTEQNQSTAVSSAFESTTDSFYDSKTPSTPSPQLSNTSMSFGTLEI